MPRGTGMWRRVGRPPAAHGARRHARAGAAVFMDHHRGAGSDRQAGGGGQPVKHIGRMGLSEFLIILAYLGSWEAV